MARVARVVAEGMPHHVTQRGNRRQQTFFCDEDYVVYRQLMAEWCAQCGVVVWAYCLMPNHVHLIVVPHSEEGCGTPLGRRIAVIHGGSIFGRDGVGICGRGGSHRTSWMNPTC